MKSGKNILLNYIPPIRNVYPSAGLSILKSFLMENGWGCRVVYWNILMEHIMGSLPYTDKRDMLPFMYMLAKEHGDITSENAIISYVISQSTGTRTTLECKNFLEEAVDEIHSITDKELQGINFDDVLIFGISLKFYQFIPAMYFARVLKNKFPGVYTVAGGIRNRGIAEEYMGICRDLDFAIWGEGEYPLLQLSEQLHDQHDDFDKIPRLVFRKNNSIRISTAQKGKFLDFKNYIFPDYSDYKILDISSVIFPINSVRSCYWDKCRFCIFGDDYIYRERDPDSIIQEIESVYHAYGIKHFHFIDNDVIGTKPERFEKLLDLLIGMTARLHTGFIFWAEIIHKNISAEMFRKMKKAGFSSANFGIEAISENLLKKMNKRTGLADNLFALKTATRFHIQPGGNIIYNLPDETGDDVLDSIANLHYLRFLFSDKTQPFSFNYRDFVLQKGTAYYENLSEKIIEEHKYNHIAALLPEKFFAGRNRFHLFGYTRTTANLREWNEFQLLEAYYKKASYHYSFKNINGEITYSEYKNKKLLYSFNCENIRLKILKILDEQIVTIEALQYIIRNNFPDATDNQILSELNFLKMKQLVYFDGKYQNITSVVLTSG